MFTYAQILRLFEIYQEVENMVETVAFVDRLPWTLVSCVMVFVVFRFVYNSKTRYRRLEVALRENSQLERENVNLSRRLVVVLRENSQFVHEIEYLRGLPNAFPAALRQRQPQGVPRLAPLNVHHGILIGPLPIEDGLVHIQNGPPQIHNGLPQIEDGPPHIQNGPPPIPVPVAMHVPGEAQGVVHGPVERQMPRRTLKKALDHMQKLTESLKKDSELLTQMEAKHKV